MRDLLPGLRFLRWRYLAARGYDPYAISRDVSLWRGFSDHVRRARAYRRAQKETA